MVVHYSLKFETLEFTYHGSFDVDFSTEIILKNKAGVSNLAIKDAKQKTNEVFKIDFNLLKSIEVYIYENGEEILILKKEK